MNIKGHSCTNCKHPGDIHESPCDECIFGSNWERKPITNGDRIRAMTDEELAELIGDTIDCGFCKDMANRDVCPVSTDNERDCHKYWLDWLKQEVSND